MARSLICMDCFSRFKPNEVWFRCINPASRHHSSESSSCFEVDGKTKQMKRHAFPVRGFGNQLRARNRSLLRLECDVCGFTSDVRICPHCHCTLRVGFGEIPERIIAVVGNKGAGKAHYFSVLIEKVLRGEIGEGFGAVIWPADQETMYLWREYTRPLLDEERQISVWNIEVANSRLVFIFQINSGGEKRRAMLVFCDVASELLQGTINKDELTVVTRYLLESSAIIYLANPKDVPEWRRLLMGSDVHSDPLLMSDPYLMFTKVMAELRKAVKQKPGRRISIPLAVCISQFDRLKASREVLGLGQELFDGSLSPVRDGRIDHEAIQRESDAIRDFMMRTDPITNALAITAEGNFNSVRFFGVSALGAAPSPKGEIGEIRPNRVEAPFFWCLSQLKVLQSNRRF